MTTRHNNEMQLPKPAKRWSFAADLGVLRAHMSWEQVVALRGIAYICALGLLGCCIQPEQIRQQYSAGILSGAQNLRCVEFSGDLSAVQFAYEVPRPLPSPEIAQVRAQIERSMWERGATRDHTCFLPVRESPGYSLLRCSNPASGVPSAWEVRIDGRTVSLLTGPPDVVVPAE